MKTLYIFEFSREDAQNESEWFVADKGLTYDQEQKLAYDYLNATLYEGEGFTNKEIQDWVTVEQVYEVMESLIEEIITSRKNEGKETTGNIEKQILDDVITRLELISDDLSTEELQNRLDEQIEELKRIKA